MDVDIDYISRDSLPQFSDFDYKKEDPVVPSLDTEYNPEEVERVLSEEGAVLVQNTSKNEALDVIWIHMVDKLTSWGEIRKAFNPAEERGITEFYEAEDEDAVYITENQYRTRIL